MGLNWAYTGPILGLNWAYTGPTLELLSVIERADYYQVGLLYSDTSCVSNPHLVLLVCVISDSNSPGARLARFMEWRFTGQG